jgi:hypothetical protein
MDPRRFVAGLVIPVLCASATVATFPLPVAAAAAAPIVVTPDPSALPPGGAPRLPYLDVAAARIVDGSRRVGVTGLQGTVTHLHKVDGGYVVGRSTSAGPGLAFVTTSGARSALTSDWHWPVDNGIYRGVMVSRDGDTIVFNTSDRANPFGYRDTVVMAVPSGRILHRRAFSARPKLLGFDGARVLMGVGLRALWWTPGRFATSLLADGVDPMSADLSARQYVRHEASNPSDFRVVSIPPRTTASWLIPEVDWQLGYWSTDDLRIAGTGEVTDGTDEVQAFFVRRASDGEGLLTVIVAGVPQITWEDSTTVLMMTRDDGYRLIRCTLAGICHRIGASSSSRYGPYVVADRRNS